MSRRSEAIAKIVDTWHTEPPDQNVLGDSEHVWVTLQTGEVVNRACATVRGRWENSKYVAWQLSALRPEPYQLPRNGDEIVLRRPNQDANWEVSPSYVPDGHMWEYAKFVKADLAQHPAELLSLALQRSESYAWSWYCNIVMPIRDAGVSQEIAERAASALMVHLFNVDVTTMDFWAGVEKEWGDSTEEAMTNPTTTGLYKAVLEDLRTRATVGSPDGALVVPWMGIERSLATYLADSDEKLMA